MQWLQLCSSNTDRRNSFEHMRSVGVSPEMMTQLMQEADAEARRCQTITPRHQAMLGELALRAMRGGMREAAAKYAGVTPPDDLPTFMHDGSILPPARSAGSKGD